MSELKRQTEALMRTRRMIESFSRLVTSTMRNEIFPAISKYASSPAGLVDIARQSIIASRNID